MRDPRRHRGGDFGSRTSDGGMEEKRNAIDAYDAREIRRAVGGIASCGAIVVEACEPHAIHRGQCVELEARLVNLAAEVLDVDPVKLGPDDGVGKTPGWTSLAHLNLIVAIEETFDLRLPTSRLPQLTTLGKLQEELLRHAAG